jgi:hypothetical protein
MEEVDLQNPYFQNTISSFIFLFLILAGGWIVHHFSTRRALLSFFNITHPKRIIIYLSHLRITEGGAIGIDNIPRSFAQSAIPVYESNLIPIFQRLFNVVIPGVESQPGFLQKLLVSDVAVEVVPSPIDDGDIDRQSTFIAVGSPGYNIASSRAENKLHSNTKFSQDNNAIEVPDVPPLTDKRYGFVQRVVDRMTGQIAFYVAGVSSVGTTCAALFLAKRWLYLSKKYPGKKDFCIVVKATTEDGRSYEIVFERG